MLLDIDAITHAKVYRLSPCVCGSRSFHLEGGMNWQCSRCKPPGKGAIRYELEAEPSSAPDQEVTPTDGEDVQASTSI